MSEVKKISQEFIDKINHLSPEKLAEVFDFVEFLESKQDQGRLAHGMMKLSEKKLSDVWDNDDDAIYDQL